MEKLASFVLRDRIVLVLNDESPVSQRLIN